MSHSHLDAGWRKTFQGYYDWKVHTIFEQTIAKLLENATYTYTVGDIAFFKRYYTELTSAQ